MKTPAKPLTSNPSQDHAPLLQRAAVNSEPVNEVPPIVHEVLQSFGQPLDSEARALFEPRFGHDFSQVRVHTDAKAGESTRAVNALAYTVGHHVVFGGTYEPRTSRGKEILAHELTHVAQQHPDNSFTAQPSLDRSSSDNAESEARANARRSNETTPLAAQPLVSKQLQRLSPEEDDPMHRAMLEAWRQEHGLPPGGVNASGERVGPSDAEIKYGGLLTRGQGGPSEAERDFALFGGIIASYSVDKQGNILGWKMDQIAKKVYELLLANKNAYIRINGRYQEGNTDFAPNRPLETAKAALVQWIGTSKIPDLEKRIVTYHGASPDAGASIAIEVAYSSQGPNAVAPGPDPQVSPELKEPRKPNEGGLETKFVLVPLAYDDGKVKATATLKASFKLLGPIKKVSSSKAVANFGEVELESELGLGAAQKVGEPFKPKVVNVAELGASLSLVEIKLIQPMGIFPKGLKVALSLNISGNLVEGKVEPKGEFKLQHGPFFFKLEGNTESGGGKLGVEFDLP